MDQDVINLLFGGAMAALGWFGRVLWDADREIRQDLSHLRAVRAAEFAPLDVKATIPSEAAAAEAARQAIRDKYAAIQADIDAAPGVPELKLIADSIQP